MWIDLAVWQTLWISVMKTNKKERELPSQVAN